ncbi:hypothetical protein BJX68DRAFT_227150 [Aspergillus pseudodeflectus]|uniref:Uncharacterized protein n=1 Tax=Aspergillus pseudodeflectus TaxID=176178 RepID=A0ABR4L5I1_9EURO
MRPSRRPGSIAIANLNASSGELSPSDSEDAAASAPGQPVGGAADEADDVIGVSMNYVQSRLKARSTPAEERSRIMERNGGYFDDPDGLFAPEITEEPEDFADAADVAHAGEKADKEDSAKTSAAMGSKEGAGGGSRSSFTRSLLMSTLPLRPRAWSGDSSTGYRGLKKFFPSLHLRTASLAPRRPRSWSSKLNLEQETSPAPVSAASRSPVAAFPSPDSPVTNGATAGVPAEDPIGELKPLQAPSAKTPGKHSFVRSNNALRRSSSDQSLYLRASSTASSLEHRPQYEHIHSQTNSRFKAIKDTLQDSSSRLLSMPSLHFQDLRSDWGYKQFLSDASHRRLETNATDDTFGSTATSATPSEIRAVAEEAPPPRTRSPRSSVAATYPMLYDAMSELTGDVVVMGGYRGSILRSAKPPHRQLWVPMKVGLNLRKVDLEVGLTREDEERMEETIIPDGVLSHIGPVDICRRLLKRLQKCENTVRGDLRVHNYGYDWRLSPHLLSQRLIRYLEGLPCNAPDVPSHKRGAWVIAHSLGGLITRHAVNQRPELFAGVVYAGVPQHCVNILGPLRNGDDVLLSSRVLTAQVNFTFRTSFALLPEKGHCFINKHTKEEYRLDFFDPEVWDEYRLSPCISPPLPAPTPARTGSSLSLKDKNVPMRKRFSTMLSNSSITSTDEADLYTSTPNSTDNSSSTTGVQQHLKPSHIMPTGEGLVGPTANPKGSSSVSPTQQPVTIPPEAARAYLKRTLAEIAAFKHETLHNAQHQESNKYPPFAVLYSKCVPTVYGARVTSREAIKRADAYDDLAFAAGDGVCLASAAMLPHGYKVIRDGLVKSERGHVGLLGDLEGIGVCLRALVKGRREGVGISSSPSPSSAATSPTPVPSPSPSAL